MGLLVRPASCASIGEDDLLLLHMHPPRSFQTSACRPRLCSDGDRRSTGASALHPGEDDGGVMSRGEDDRLLLHLSASLSDYLALRSRGARTTMGGGVVGEEKPQGSGGAEPRTGRRKSGNGRRLRAEGGGSDARHGAAPVRSLPALLSEGVARRRGRWRHGKR